MSEKPYRSPSREYLVGLLDQMRDADGRAGQSLARYRRVRGDIEVQVNGRAERDSWGEEAIAVALQVEVANSRALDLYMGDYRFWRDVAMHRAQTLQAEHSMYYLLGEAPEDEVAPDSSVPQNEGDGVLRVDQRTQLIPVVEGGGDGQEAR